jgi:hypothetical protein
VPALPKPKPIPPGRKWKKGESGNPGGKPIGARDRLSRMFLRSLHNDFSQHGEATIVRLRELNPALYLKLIADLVPTAIKQEEREEAEERERTIDVGPDGIVEHRGISEIVGRINELLGDRAEDVDAVSVPD